MSGTETTASQFEETPEGWARRWQFEIKKAKEELQEFYKQAAKADDSLRDTPADNGGRRLCLYASSNQVVGAMLVGRTPKASVSRKFADAKDDPARVASSMMERVLNCDIQRTDDTFTEATRNAMVDWLNASLGVNWHRYDQGEVKTTPGEAAVIDAVTGKERAPAVLEQVSRPNEQVNTDYVHYKDFLWSPGCRTWDEVTWVARRIKMSKESLAKRFDTEGAQGEKLSEQVPLNSKHTTPEDDKAQDSKHPWNRAEVWELWHKDSKKVFWVVEGFPKTLDIKDDTLQLSGFFPCQRPLLDNPTNSKLVPIPKFKFIQDLENNINKATTRIEMLVDGAQLSGLYAKELGDLVQKLIKGREGELHPVDEWAMFADKGGLAGAIVWKPLAEIVATIGMLNNQRQADMDLMYQVTGQSDLIRGQQTANGTPGEARIKAKSASVRIQSMQDEIARFASDGQRIRAEIISKHFSPQTIVAHSNIMQTPDAQAIDAKTQRPLVEVAVELIKSRFSDYRIEIKPEAINLTDFAALKEERVEVMSAVGAFFQQAAPIMQMGPQGMKFALQMLQVTLAGLKGAAAYESIIDSAVSEVEQAQKAAKANPPQQQADPKVIAQQMKGQQEQAKIQAETQARLVEINAEMQADAQREMNQRQQNVMEHAAKQQISAAMRPAPMPMKPGGM